MHFPCSNAAGQNVALRKAVTSESITGIEFQLQDLGGMGTLGIVLEDS